MNMTDVGNGTVKSMCEELQRIQNYITLFSLYMHFCDTSQKNPTATKGNNTSKVEGEHS